MQSVTELTLSFFLISCIVGADGLSNGFLETFSVPFLFPPRLTFGGRQLGRCGIALQEERRVEMFWDESRCCLYSSVQTGLLCAFCDLPRL